LILPRNELYLEVKELEIMENDPNTSEGQTEATQTVYNVCATHGVAFVVDALRRLGAFTEDSDGNVTREGKKLKKAMKEAMDAAKAFDGAKAK